MGTMKEKQLILIVEDEMINRRILKKILAETYDIIEAENGAVAWNILKEKKYKVSAVLLDIVMPVMNGYMFLEKITQHAMTELPVIVMTGEADNETERRVLDAGAWDFVTKPYQPKVLLSRLRNAIARRQVSVYEKMQKMAAHDSLTGLYNRARMFSRTRQLLDENPEQQFLFLRVDVDHFALYNSAFGEEEGDKLLCYLGKIFAEMAESYKPVSYGRMNADIFCACVRYGGDEKQLLRVVHEVQKRLSEYRNDYLLEISVGAYVLKDTTLSVEECYLRASMGAQKCKSQYGKHIGYYDESEGKRAADEIAITNEMQKALEEKQFLIYLQPKVNLSTDSACGAEALVRWKHPERGLISPGVFIPVFERNGFIASLDYYVWEQTCSMLKKWTDSGKRPFPVSVNISRISLYNPQLVDLLIGLVEKYQIEYTLLQLEITESAYMTNPDLMQDTIHALRNAGFTILMDDFGSGYSSLNTLKDIEFDVLKIDMKFLPVGQEVEKGEIILASMIKMANWLGMSVVVEGVETRKQRDFLEGAGCECVQGYFYSRPVPQEEYEQKYIYNEKQIQKDEAQRKNQSVCGKNATIVVIDDEELDRTLICEYFKDRYNVEPCRNAEEALIYLKYNKKHVRLIILDNMMPGMSGIDFLTYCQDEPFLSAIPKIMITASDNATDQIQAFKCGAYDYITKPLIREVVEARVNHVMNISKQYRIYENWESDYRDLAERDRATGLLNKTAFQEMSTRIMEAYPDDCRALLVIDFDNFKEINDNYGHLTGDKVLQSIADVLKRIFRKSDLIGRFGGDEFMALMINLPNQEIARKKAEDIIKAIAIECVKKNQLNVGVSIGISFSTQMDTFDTIFGRADEALYEAKNTGKGKVVVYGEKVPPIVDDDKTIVLVCSEDVQLYPTIALAYGDSAGFSNIRSMEQLKEVFEKYGSRIGAICMDMQKWAMKDSDEFYQYILEHGGAETIPLLAVCKEGNMNQLRTALSMKFEDILTLPPHIDTIQRRLYKAVMLRKGKR